MSGGSDCAGFQYVGKQKNHHEDALGFDFKWNHGWKNDFDKFMQSDPLFRKGVYQKLTDNMLYFYSEFFIQELHITEQELPGSNDGEKHANMRLATAYQYCYPGKKRTAENCTGTLPQSFMEALNAFYKEHPALYTADYEPEGFAWTDTQDEQETVLAFVRRSMVSDSTSQDLLVIANFTPVVRKDFRMGVLEPGKYKEIFNTDAAHFGGQNILNEQQLSSEKVEIAYRLTRTSCSRCPCGSTTFQENLTVSAASMSGGAVLFCWVMKDIPII